MVENAGCVPDRSSDSAGIISVAVFMTTYNHEAFVGKAVEGVLAQECAWPVTLFIGDDCSRDGTSRICSDLAETYPDRIRYVRREINLGMAENARLLLNDCVASGATYLAFCEGDDYWTDTHKLQLQVSFLEANPGFGLCLHEADVEGLFSGLHSAKPQHGIDTTRTTFDMRDLIGGLKPATASVVARVPEGFVLPLWQSECQSGDLALWPLLCGNRKVHFLNRSMSTYRSHGASVTKSSFRFACRYVRQRNWILMYMLLNEHFRYRWHVSCSKRIYRLLLEANPREFAFIRRPSWYVVYTPVLLAYRLRRFMDVVARLFRAAKRGWHGVRRWLAWCRGRLRVARAEHIRLRNENRRRRKLQAAMDRFFERVSTEQIDSVAIFGAGKHTTRLFELFPHFAVSYIVDEKLAGQTMGETPIVAPSHVLEAPVQLLVLSTDTFQDDMQQKALSWDIAGMKIHRLYPTT